MKLIGESICREKAVKSTNSGVRFLFRDDPFREVTAHDFTIADSPSLELRDGEAESRLPKADM
jgi:hypothetical protein